MPTFLRHILRSEYLTMPCGVAASIAFSTPEQRRSALPRTACPEYDVEVLYDVLLNHAPSEGAKVAFAFGVYDAVQTGHASH